MTTKEKELFEKKVTIKDWLVIKLCNILNLPKNYTGTIVCMDFNTPKVMKLVKAYFHQARVIFMEQANFEKLFGISGLYYKDEGERIDMLKSIEGNLIIIANPPYGAIGANITDILRQKIDYKEFINLLPANDYKRNKTKDLFKYQSNMVAINDGFIDAAVTTHVAKIHKGTVEDPAPNINMTLDEFERSQYIDRNLDKYFEENSKRTHYAIDNAQARPKWTKYIQETVTVDNSFIIHMRDANHGYIPNNANKKNPATSVRWNLLRELSLDYLHEHYWQNDTQSVYGFITFKTVIERNNFTDFMLKHGWTFMCKVMKAMCVDCTVAFSKYLPKVDWTRSWTVEEILKDYGYTEDEIKTVMADLDNFKGMDD